MNADKKLLLIFEDEETDSPPGVLGFLIDNLGNFISDNENIPIVYQE